MVLGVLDHFYGGVEGRGDEKRSRASEGSTTTKHRGFESSRYGRSLHRGLVVYFWILCIAHHFVGFLCLPPSSVLLVNSLLMTLIAARK